MPLKFQISTVERNENRNSRLWYAEIVATPRFETLFDPAFVYATRLPHKFATSASRFVPRHETVPRPVPSRAQSGRQNEPRREPDKRCSSSTS
ncbi:hypothetical protein FQR65_LT07726 [Abscondita terminalis]|nr:hypothetical protein FQR65_LT07726 [Abscondita terminalis]